MNLLWVYIIGGLFAVIGVGTVVCWIMRTYNQVMEAAHNVTSMLRDATEVAKAYREDVQILKQIAQSAQTPNFGVEEPESIIPRQPAAAMPAPYWGRYPIKPEEPDAPAEASRDVDVTATDEELEEFASNEQAADFETTERHKAATREADRVRLKELAELSGVPEGQ